MSNEIKGESPKVAEAPFTTERMRNLVMEHVLDNACIFTGDGMTASHFTAMMDSLSKLAEKVALQAVANRMNLSPLPTFESQIEPDPFSDLFDETLYEMRYRILEKNKAGETVRDEALTKSKAVTTYGENFVEKYWGGLGELCPNKVSSPSRDLWFTVVRYPVEQADANHAQEAQQRSKGPS